MKYFSVDVGIYSTCAFLMIRLILIYAFIVLVLFCHVDVDVDNVQSPQRFLRVLLLLFSSYYFKWSVGLLQHTDLLCGREIMPDVKWSVGLLQHWSVVW